MFVVLHLTFTGEKNRSEITQNSERKETDREQYLTCLPTFLQPAQMRILIDGSSAEGQIRTRLNFGKQKKTYLFSHKLYSHHMISLPFAQSCAPCCVPSRLPVRQVIKPVILTN